MTPSTTKESLEVKALKEEKYDETAPLPAAETDKADLQKEQHDTSLFSSILEKASAGLDAISNGIGAGYLHTGSTNGPKETIQSVQAVLIEWAKADGANLVNQPTLDEVEKEMEKGTFGANTELLLKAFQNSARLDKETGELTLLNKDSQGTGLVPDGVLGIRSLNALSQWAMQETGNDPSNKILADMGGAMEKHIATTSGPYADQTKFDTFVRMTGGKWNVEDGVGDGDDYISNRDYAIGDNEFSDPNFGKLSDGAMNKVKNLAGQLGLDPDWLLAVMSFETGGTFSPSVKNGANSGATGLIQFMPETAAGLGTSTSALATMSQEEQMDYVCKYFDSYKIANNGGQPKLQSLEDLYMAVLLPTAIGKSNDSVLFTPGTIAYDQNGALDTNFSDGGVTKGEASQKVKEQLEKLAPSA
jgi:hypothetical protein